MARENRERGWQDRKMKGEMARENRERRWQERTEKKGEMAGDSRKSGDGRKGEKPEMGERAVERKTADYDKGEKTCT
jgi:hypothetical protein